MSSQVFFIVSLQSPKQSQSIWPAWVHRRKVMKPSHPERIVRKEPVGYCALDGDEGATHVKSVPTFKSLQDQKPAATFRKPSPCTTLISSKNPTHLPQYFSKKNKSLSNSISIRMSHLLARVPTPSYTILYPCSKKFGLKLRTRMAALRTTHTQYSPAARGGGQHPCSPASFVHVPPAQHTMATDDQSFETAS